MYPTFENGELVFVNKLAYTMSEPEIGDVVIAVEPIDNEKVIKRITGVPGSTVSYMGKSIVLNEDEYFIEGDNVDSTDSKSYGAIPEDRILGQVVTTK